MKTTLVLLVTFCTFTMAQATNTPEFNDLQIGSELMIGKPSSNKYAHLELPKMNFIIKKGGIPNDKTLFNNKVVITSMKELPDGSVEVSLKRKNGQHFFNSHPQIKAKLHKAITSKELIRLQ